MRKHLFIIIFLCFGALNAQRIILCKAYTNNGEPIDYIYSSTLLPAQSVCILFSGEKKTIAGENITLYIDKLTGGKRQNQFKKSFRPSKANWVATVYKFSLEGKFEIYFTDDNNYRLSAKTVIVPGQNPVKNIEPYPDQSYPSAEITFCEEMQSGKPAGIKKSIYLPTEEGKICIYINNTRPLKTERILLNIWRKLKYERDYKDLIDSRKYQVDPSWSDTFFRYKFSRAGDYKIDLYDEREILIKTAYISVTN